MAEHLNFFKVPHSITSEEKFLKMKSSSKVLYMTFCKLANIYGDTDNWFFRSIRDLSEDSGLHIQTVMKSKRELINNEYILCKPGKYESQNFRGSDNYKVVGFVPKS